MDFDDLLAEATRLIRPCTYLVEGEQDEQAAAIWGGEPAGLVPSSCRHWLAIDSRFISASENLPAALGICLNEEDCRSGLVLPLDHLEAVRGGRRLVARAAQSLPPENALVRFGGPMIQSWLSQLGWHPNWGLELPDPDLAERYQRVFQPTCPLYGEGEVAAVLGGWHFPWPDGDWEEWLDATLIAWTFWESEPWAEVWLRQGRFDVQQRIT